MTTVQQAINDVLADVVAIRHDLHAHPELSFDLPRTAGRVTEVLESLGGFEVRTGVAETGVVATLNGTASGACVALRAEIDALPITEETGRAYASTTAGRMHACGHDGHTTCLLGTAMVLSRLADRLPGPVRFVFQPAEETDGGADRMCDEGALDDPPVAAMLALHGWPYLDAGEFGVRPGPAMAASNPFSIRVKGHGGHAASPHLAIDPIVVTARIIDGLQTIAARVAMPQDQVVVTVGQVHAGTAGNVIPFEAFMEGTIRTTDPKTRTQVVGQVRRIAECTAQAHGASAEVNIAEGYPALLNDPQLAAYVIDTARSVLGDDKVTTDLPISMGVDDFSYFAQRVPAVMLRIGLRPPGADSYPALHTPGFDFNDDALPVGIRLLCELILQYESMQATGG